MYGPRGSGKMTRIRTMLQELFDGNTSKVSCRNQLALSI